MAHKSRYGAGKTVRSGSSGASKASGKKDKSATRKK